MRAIVRLIYITTTLAGMVGALAVALGWRPPVEIIASAAFVALCFAANARDTQAANDK